MAQIYNALQSFRDCSAWFVAGIFQSCLIIMTDTVWKQRPLLSLLQKFVNHGLYAGKLRV